MRYFSEKELLDSPSYRDGIPQAKIDAFRFKGCELIEKLAGVFRLPKLSVASAKVFFHRQSFKQYDAWLIAATCLFLAAKVEEHYVKAVDFSKHYLALQRKLNHDAAPSDLVYPRAPSKPHSVESQTEELLFHECVVLHVLAYDLGIVHPYAYVNEFVSLGLASVKCTDDTAMTLKRGAWSFLNDSSNTYLCLQFEPRVIAIVAVYLAGSYASLWTQPLDVDAPSSWWKQVNAPITILADAAKALLETYVKGYSYKKRPLPEGILKLLEEHGQGNPCIDEEIVGGDVGSM